MNWTESKIYAFPLYCLADLNSKPFQQIYDFPTAFLN